MTEEEWLVGEDPEPIVEFLWSKVSDRKLRLIACGCCRQIWNTLTDLPSREAVEVSERFADGLATDEELRRASWRAEAATFLVDENQVYLAAVAAEYAAGHPGNFLQQVDRSILSLAVVRDVVGNPFRPVALDPAWLTSTVVALAKGIYEERAFDRMPILADALQDAGCDCEEVLSHCRDATATHVRGCWVVDLVLGKM